MSNNPERDAEQIAYLERVKAEVERRFNLPGNTKSKSQLEQEVRNDLPKPK